MDDKTLQRKLDQLATLANEIDAEAKRRYGPEGNLFFEAGGTFHVMDGDDNSRHSFNRQDHSRMASRKHCALGSGAW